MRTLPHLLGALALGLGAQAASAYSGTATLTFTFGGSAVGANADQAFVASAGPITVPGMANGTMFSSLAGANSASYYNQNFASTAQCAPGAGVVPGAFTVVAARKYGCRAGTTSPTLAFIRIPVADTGPLGQASGTLSVTDTSLTGTLTIVSTTDEPQGAVTTVFNGVRVSTSVGDGSNGYNYRTGDGSPFGNSWYGITTAGTLTVNLTGTFTASSWTINGGTVTFTDGGFACQQGGFGGAAEGTLCQISTAAGGFSPDGGQLSWGLDADGAGAGGVSMIDVRDPGGGSTVATLSGVLASLTLDGAGNITGGTGEFRRASGSASGGCPTNIRYDTGTNQIICGSLTAGRLAVTGSVATALVPAPAAGWLMASAIGLLAGARRRRTAHAALPG